MSTLDARDQKRQQRRSKEGRWRIRPLSIAVMTAVWMVLWGSVSPMIIVGGLIFSYLITVVFPLPPIHWVGRFRPIGFVVLSAHLLFDLVVSSMRILQLAFEKKVNLNAGIIRVDLASDNDLYQVQVAQVISLVPGTVVVEVVKHPRRLYLHTLDLIGDDPVARVQKMVHEIESRVLHAFASNAEIAAFDVELERLKQAELLKQPVADEAPEMEDEES